MKLIQLLSTICLFWSMSCERNLTETSPLVQLLSQKSPNVTAEAKNNQNGSLITTIKPSFVDVPKIIELQPLVFDMNEKAEQVNQTEELKTSEMEIEKKQAKKTESQNIKKYVTVSPQNKTTVSGKPMPGGDLFVKRKSKLLSLDKVKQFPTSLPKFSTRKPMIEYANMAKIPLMEVRRTTLKNDAEIEKEKRPSTSTTPEVEASKSEKQVDLNKKTGESNNSSSQAFFYKFQPQENPIRSEIEQMQNESHAAADGNQFYNINNLPNAKGKHNSFVEDLQTSESRQRSKIEIKEVNGTLYEYEYIYYYDDEYPSYDDVSPDVTDYDTKSNLVSGNRQDTSNQVNAPVTSQVEHNTITNNAVNIQHTTPLLKDSRAVLAKENEILPKNANSADRHQNLQNSRGRALSTDSSNAQNSLHEISIEHLKLPDHTRFPPREVTTQTNFEPSLIDASNDNTIGINQNIVDPLETTTELTEDSTDRAVIDLYALSRAVDANFVETTTLIPEEEGPISSIDYDALYDYDFSLSELEGIDLESTTEIPTTDPPTTIISTTTTTAAPASKKSSSLNIGRTRGSARSKLGGSRISKIRGLNRGGSNTEKPENIVEEKELASLTTTAKDPRASLKKFARPSLRGRNRFRGKQSVSETTEKENVRTTTSEPITEETTTRGSPRSPSRNRFSKPRTNLRGRGKPKPRAEEPTTAVNEDVLETTTEQKVVEKTRTTTKDSRRDRLAKNRFRRPPSSRSNLLGRFNRNKKVENTEPKSIDKETLDAKQESLNTTATEPENKIEGEPETSKVTETTPANTKSKFNRRHRFNIPKRNRPSRNRLRQPVDAKEEDPVAEKSVVKEATEEIVTTEEPAKPTEATTKKSGRNFRRFGGRNDRNNPTQRFRTRGVSSNNKIIEINDESISSATADITTPSGDITQTRKAEVETPSIPSSPVNTRPSRNKPFRRNSSNRRKLPPIFERKPEVVSPKQSHELAAKSELEEKKSAVTIEEEKVEPEPEPEPEPVPAEEPAQDEQEEASKVVTEEENNPTEPPTLETTTKKLTRRQILAQRRAQFLRNG